MQAVTGVVQHYEWGDLTSIPTLLGAEPDGRPWAELWLGTHPGAPSTLVDGSPLAASAGELPYLLKVLAAGKALSLQTHPNAAQARTGFDDEASRSIQIGAPERIYRDPSPKPELICALTAFDALCGFRPVAATDAMLRAIGADDLADLLAERGLADTVAQIYRGEFDGASTIAGCSKSAEAPAELVTQLNEQYPGDHSVLVTLLLNRVQLQPGEALFLGPGNLHAYLHGVGVEIMGASDNVVRGGLTVKHVDVEELLRVLDIVPLHDPLVAATGHGNGCVSFDTPDTPFRLWRCEVDQQFELVANGRELLLCTSGDLGVLHRGQAGYLSPGEQLIFEGHGVVFRVEERPIP